MLSPKIVLAVDDNATNLEILSEMLSGEYRVMLAMSGPEAFRIAKKYRPGVILLDVMMPGMNGLEVCRHLREIRELGDCYIAMVSAKAMPSEQAAGIAAGADIYLTKPFDEAQLLSLLRGVFGPEVINQQRRDPIDGDQCELALNHR